MFRLIYIFRFAYNINFIQYIHLYIVLIGAFNTLVGISPLDGLMKLETWRVHCPYFIILIYLFIGVSLESHVRQELFLVYDKISYTLYSSYLLKGAMIYRYEDMTSKYSVEYIAGGNCLIGGVAIF